MKRIGLFGGSFDPPHQGHRQMALSFLESKLIDELWVMPVFDAPHKDGSQQTPFEHRLNMAKIAFSDLKQTVVTDIEASLERPNYSLRTVLHLKKQYPDYTFLFCMGADSLVNLTKWFKYDEILAELDILAVRRPGVELIVPQELDGHYTIIEAHKQVDMDSSSIRENYFESGQSRALNVDVEAYINRQKVYTAE